MALLLGRQQQWEGVHVPGLAGVLEPRLRDPLAQLLVEPARQGRMSSDAGRVLVVGTPHVGGKARRRQRLGLGRDRSGPADGLARPWTGRRLAEELRDERVEVALEKPGRRNPQQLASRRVGQREAPEMEPEPIVAAVRRVRHDRALRIEGAVGLFALQRPKHAFGDLAPVGLTPADRVLTEVDVAPLGPPAVQRLRHRGGQRLGDQVLPKRVPGHELVVAHVAAAPVIAQDRRTRVAHRVAHLVGQDQLEVVEVSQRGRVVETHEDAVLPTIEAAVPLGPLQPR